MWSCVEGDIAPRVRSPSEALPNLPHNFSKSGELRLELKFVDILSIRDTTQRKQPSRRKIEPLFGSHSAPDACASENRKSRLAPNPTWIAEMIQLPRRERRQNRTVLFNLLAQCNQIA